MTKVRLKLPSIKSTSKDIAEDLKAIREALSAKPTNEKGKPASLYKHKTKPALNKKQQNGFVNSSTADSPEFSKNKADHVNAFSNSPVCSVDDQQASNSNSKNRPIRQRKPNQRYTDLTSEKQEASRKRTVSAVSNASSDDEFIPEPKAVAKSSDKKKSKAPSSSKKNKASKQARPAADTQDEYSDFDLDTAIVTEKLSQSKKKRASPNKKRSANQNNVGFRMEPLTPPPGPAAGGFEAPPEFDDEEESGVPAQRLLANRSLGVYGSALGVMVDDDVNFERRRRSPQRSTTMGGAVAAAARPFEATQPTTATHNVGAGVASTFSSLNDFANVAVGQYEAQADNSSNAYDERGGGSDYNDDGPLLVYGPGPRTLTYNGEYYPLAPVVFKRRPGKFPRPRSSRYKPFSPNYKPPDVSRFRERFKKMGGSRRGRGRRGGSSMTSAIFRRAAMSSTSSAYLSSMGGGAGVGGESRWSYDHLLQMDETKDAVEALRSSFGGVDVGGGPYGGDGYAKASTFDDFYDAEAYLAANDMSTQRRRGGRRRGGGGPAFAEDAAARGVYAELASTSDDGSAPTHSSMLEPYRYGYGKPLHENPPSSLLSTTAAALMSNLDGGGGDEPRRCIGVGRSSKFCFIPPEISGDHCYIKPKGGASVVTVDVEPSAGSATVDPSVAGIAVDDHDEVADGPSTTVVVDDGTVIIESIAYVGSGSGQSAVTYRASDDDDDHHDRSAPARSGFVARSGTAPIGGSRIREQNRQFPSNVLAGLRPRMEEEEEYDEGDDEEEEEEEEEEEFDEAPPRVFKPSNRY